LRTEKLLARVKANLVLQPIRRFSDGSYLAKIYHNAKARRHDRGGIVVRVIDYALDDPQRAKASLPATRVEAPIPWITQTPLVPTAPR